VNNVGGFKIQSIHTKIVIGQHKTLMCIYWCRDFMEY